MRIYERKRKLGIKSLCLLVLLVIIRSTATTECYNCLCSRIVTIPACIAEVPGWIPRQGEIVEWPAFISFVSLGVICSCYECVHSTCDARFP